MQSGVADGQYVFVVRTAFYPLRYEGRFADGLREGLWRVTRLDTGGVTWETTWHQGRWHGRSTSYWKNGLKLKQGEHHDGFEQGLWRFWFENGTLAAEGRYEAGRKSGQWDYWDEDGNRLPYELWEMQYDHWDWAYDDMTGFPHGSNWPDPPADATPSPPR